VLLFGVRQLGPTEFVVEREAVRSLLELPPHELARVVPFVREGVPAGVKLYGVRECSPLRLLGLQNGDRLVRIDGVPLDDGSVFASATRRVNASDRVRLDLERRGRSLTLWYAIE
jgi:type II secretory pathway component PulC